MKRILLPFTPGDEETSPASDRPPSAAACAGNDRKRRPFSARSTERLPCSGRRILPFPAPRYRTSEGKFMVTTRGDVERSSSRPS